jgi:hypothetical protein
VANYTYQYLFCNGLKKLDPAEAATALNHAVLHLQEDSNVTLDRWAPFIPFGIWKDGGTSLFLVCKRRAGVGHLQDTGIKKYFIARVGRALVQKK